MRMNSNVALLLAAGAFGLATSTAQAGPVGMGGLKAASDTSLTQVDYRKCWYDDGDRVCRWYKGKPTASRSNEYVDVGTRSPEEFATGSSEWWRAMDRQGRGGFGRQ
jgi:hypothetical protein